jgi:hypothetical protein
VVRNVCTLSQSSLQALGERQFDTGSRRALHEKVLAAKLWPLEDVTSQPMLVPAQAARRCSSPPAALVTEEPVCTLMAVCQAQAIGALRESNCWPQLRHLFLLVLGFIPGHLEAVVAPIHCSTHNAKGALHAGPLQNSSMPVHRCAHSAQCTAMSAGSQDRARSTACVQQEAHRSTASAEGCSGRLHGSVEWQTQGSSSGHRASNAYPARLPPASCIPHDFKAARCWPCSPWPPITGGYCSCRLHQAELPFTAPPSGVPPCRRCPMCRGGSFDRLRFAERGCRCSSSSRCCAHSPQRRLRKPSSSLAGAGLL